MKRSWKSSRRERFNKNRQLVGRKELKKTRKKLIAALKEMHTQARLITDILKRGKEGAATDFEVRLPGNEKEPVVAVASSDLTQALSLAIAEQRRVTGLETELANAQVVVHYGELEMPVLPKEAANIANRFSTAAGQGRKYHTHQFVDGLLEDPVKKVICYRGERFSR